MKSLFSWSFVRNRYRAYTRHVRQSLADYAVASGDGGVDRAWYLRRYPDVAAAGVDPVEHYLQSGWREGRDPRPDFSTSGYREANEDAEGNPLLHYLRRGGTKVPPPEWQFVADYHLASGHGGVDRAWYLRRYPDVAVAGVDPVEHYLQSGWREDRDPRPDFSTSAYREANRRVAGNPFLHYLRTPRAAHSRAGVETAWYLLWKKGLLHPQGGQALVSGATSFGSPGVPKLLFAGHEASRTGAPFILLHLMQTFQRRGIELYLILERGGPLLEDYQRIAHVLVNHNDILHLPGDPNLAEMLEAIAAPKPELAICNCADSWRLINTLRAAGLPHLVSLIHERVVHYPTEVWQLIHRNSDRVLLPAAAVKTATSATQTEFQDACVVPQGLLNPDFGRRDKHAARAEIRNRLGLAPDTAIVLGCGTRDMRKGIDLFIRVASRVRAQTTHNFHFVWLGAEKGDAYFTRFIELDISLLNLTSTLSLLDEVADAEPYFLAADAFALTSRDDPFPCVVHEAMACALPIVAFDGAGGAKEALADDCGIVLPYLDVEAMADSLTSIVEAPARYADMARRAEQRVRSVYRFSEYAERVRRICEDVMAAPRKSATLGQPAADRPSGDVRPACAEKPRATHGGFARRFGALPARIGRTIRIEQWWDHKLALILSVFYATAYMRHVAVVSVWPAAIALLFAVAACAAYVSVVNDVTDRADDQRVGKSNRMAGWPIWQMALLLAALLGVAVAFAVLWRDDLRLVAAYLGSWTAFSLYSVAPFRLKTRGVFGVIADACGSHLFPMLTAALLAQRASGHPVGPLWIGAVAAWAFGSGLRGILWHQLYDAEADRKADVRTFVVRRSAVAAIRLARAALVIESLGLALFLWHSQSAWPVLFLLIYLAFAALKSRLLNVDVVIAAPTVRYAILGQEYYTFLLPLGILIACALHNPVDWIIVVAHCIVFPRPAVAFIRESRQLVQRLLRDYAPAHAISPKPHDPTRQAMTAPANPSKPSLDVAIAKAATFLRERLHSGAYGLAAVGSDGAPRSPDDKGHVFVAAPLVEALTGLLDEIDRTIVLVRILSEEQDGVWGYQSPGMQYTDETRPFLVDSDDSAFVLRTLHRLGVNREPKSLMRFYREPERLFVTWNTGTNNSVSLTAQNALHNNFLAHPEVNANIFLALRGSQFEKYVNYDMLLRAQDERGFWKAYFYPSPLYATLLVLDLTRGNPAFAAATERALTFIAGSQNADGSWGAGSDPYETALAIAALAGQAAHAHATRRGVAYLLATMGDDGSWSSRACVWESYWTEDDLWRGYDRHRAYVSARCLIALRRVAGQLQSGR